MPGLDEVFALGDIKTHADSGEWDVLVVDCAPTAETIRLLSLPDILAWYMERVFPVGRRVNRSSGRCSAGHVAARRRRQRVRAHAPLLRPPRRGEGAARRPGGHERAPGGEPRADGDRRGAPHLHVPLAVRVPGRRGGGQPPAARRHHRSVVRPVEGRPTPSTGHDRGGLRAAARCCGPSWPADELVGLDRLPRLRPTAVYGDLDPAAVLHEGEPLRVTKKGDGYVPHPAAAVRRPRRPRRGPQRRRAARARRAVPAGIGAARLAAPARGRRRPAPDRAN